MWVTAHGSGASTVTVVRAREGTTARSWTSGAPWRCAPTIRDIVHTKTRATLPTDAHLGYRAALTDESVTVERTVAGWSTPIGGGTTGRRHGWAQTNASCPHGTTFQVVSGLTTMSTSCVAALPATVQ